MSKQTTMQTISFRRRVLSGLAFTAPACALFCLNAARPAAAQTPAVGFNAGTVGVEDNAADVFQSKTGSFALGFEFTANSTAYVTSLGYFNDPSFNPATPFNTVTLNPTPTGTYSFAGPHQVGLYQVVPGVGGAAEGGALLASATVTKAGTASGDFLYTAISPVALIAGDKYVLAGVTGPTDPYVFAIQGGLGALTFSPTITYNQDRFASGSNSTLVFPGSTDPASEPGFFGPNLQISQTAPVPEASTTVSFGLLLALGFGGLVLSARRRARAK